MSDWRSYDEIAERYDRAWAPRFEIVARHLRGLVSLRPGDRLLDIGTGTGIVARAFSDAGMLVGCDRSTQMLLRAHAQAHRLNILCADAIALPFPENCFDLATASFVLSHIRDYPRALADVLRVLKPDGTLAVSNWAPPSDPYSAAWNECLSAAISQREMERALAEVAPCEVYFSQPGNLEAAVSRAGFSQVRADPVDVATDLTVEQFMEDRKLSAGARLGRQLMEPDRWARFLSSTSETFHARFGSSFRYCRSVFVVVACKS